MKQLMNIKTNLKPIPLTMRGKKRYVLFQLIEGQGMNESSVRSALKSLLEGLFGVVGLAKQRFWFILWNPETGRGILRVSLQQLDEVKLAILFVQSINGKKVIPRVLKTSGSVKKLKPFLFI